jgi:hypothetical protein
MTVTESQAPRRGINYVVNIAPVTDHVGNPALSIYRGKAKPNRKQTLPTNVPSFRILTSRETPPPLESPLRHPYSFQIYITTGLTSTSPATSPLLHHLYDMIQGTSYVKEWGLAVYFLPHADTSAIRTHYDAEKAHRADGDWPMPSSYKIVLYEPYNNFATVLDHAEWDRDQIGVVLLSWGLVTAAIVHEDEEVKTPEIEWGRRRVSDAGGVMDHMVMTSKWWTEQMEEEWQEREDEYVGLE